MNRPIAKLIATVSARRAKHFPVRRRSCIQSLKRLWRRCSPDQRDQLRVMWRREAGLKG